MADTRAAVEEVESQLCVACTEVADASRRLLKAQIRIAYFQERLNVASLKIATTRVTAAGCSGSSVTDAADAGGEVVTPVRNPNPRGADGTRLCAACDAEARHVRSRVGHSRRPGCRLDRLAPLHAGARTDGAKRCIACRFEARSVRPRVGHSRLPGCRLEG